MPDRLTDAHGEAMRERRDALFPPPRNPNHVDTIDVARWDAFEHGWNECLAALSREEGLREALNEAERVLESTMLIYEDEEGGSEGATADAMAECVHGLLNRTRAALAASPVASREDGG